MILFINACVRKESRTKSLADCLLDQLLKTTQNTEDSSIKALPNTEASHYTKASIIEEVTLENIDLKPLDEALLKQRTEYVAAGDYRHPMFDLAKQFARADKIVVAAPFWDLSFPAILKTYLENIYVTGLVSRYGSDGKPVGLCKASKLYYVTTAGGPFTSDFSYDYLRSLATEYFGIKDTKLIKAEMLDVDGFDAEELLKEAEAGISL